MFTEGPPRGEAGRGKASASQGEGRQENSALLAPRTSALRAVQRGVPVVGASPVWCFVTAATQINTQTSQPLRGT